MAPALTHAVAQPAPPRQAIWLLWDCADLVAGYDTEQDAQEARADLQHRLLCEYGPDLELRVSLTVTTAALHVNDAPVGVAR